MLHEYFVSVSALTFAWRKALDLGLTFITYIWLGSPWPNAILTVLLDGLKLMNIVVALPKR